MNSPDPDRHDALERRLSDIEAAVRAMQADLHALRAGAASSPPASATGPRPVPPHAVTPPPAPSRPMFDLDVESLIGRYGTLVLATITALAAVGTFLGWAVSRGWLGPSQRVGLGLITALALGAAGFRLRTRERSFGASLVGLALAILLVCAWAAGPLLALVPATVAFAFAALTSIALTVFAHREGDEPLWAVGFSGAAIAPFVTASGKSDLLLLSLYGAAVLSASGYAMGRRPWRIAGRLFLLAASGYTAALALGAERDYGPLLATAFPLLVAAAGVGPWIDGWSRRERFRALGALATVACLRTGIAINLPLDTVAVASLLAVAGVTWLIMVDRTHRVTAGAIAPPSQPRLYEGDWLDAGVLPLGFVLGTMMALDFPARDTGIAMAVAAAILLITVARLPQGALRDAAVFSTVLSALVASIMLLRGQPLAFMASVIALSAACFLADRVWRSATWTTLALIGFTWAFVAVLVVLTGRPSYEYPPFLTRESGVAAALVSALLVARAVATADARLVRVVTAGVLASAFMWVHQEIAFAVSPMVSTLLLVTYYAATSVAAVAAGRARRVPVLRHIGLGLAVLAAGTALYGARRLDAVGARILADLVAAAFLLAIAYWYRRPGGLRSQP